MILGFTGTRKGMPSAQRLAFYKALTELAPHEFHHGDCVGADEQAQFLVLLMDGIETHSHPSKDRKNRAFTICNTVEHPTKPPLDRDRDIVDVSDHLLATPGSMKERVRSGTWYTVRYARLMNKPITIVWPDGSTTQEEIES